MPSSPRPSSEISEAAVRDALASNAGVRTLLRMAAAQSLMNNLDAEDEMIRRENDAYFSEIHGGSNGTVAKSGESPMRVMAARDVVINQPRPMQLQPLQSQTPPASPSPEPEKPTGLLPKLALGAALLAAGAGLGVGIPWAIGAFDNSSSTTAEGEDTATSIESVQVYKPEAATE